ncbi:hypothetical protein HQN90_15685 [Paenibacillus alba]|nr:hypothetical protein [Paenibacillus alba]
MSDNKEPFHHTLLPVSLIAEFNWRYSPEFSLCDPEHPIPLYEIGTSLGGLEGKRSRQFLVDKLLILNESTPQPRSLQGQT